MSADLDRLAEVLASASRLWVVGPGFTPSSVRVVVTSDEAGGVVFDFPDEEVVSTVRNGSVMEVSFASGRGVEIYPRRD